MQDLQLRDAEIIYTKTRKSAPVVFTGTEVSIKFSEKAGPTVALRTTVKQNGENLGQIVLRAMATPEIDFTALQHGEWRGEVELADLQLQQVGRMFGEHWPALRFDLKGRLQGKGAGLVDFTGTMNAGDFQLGEVRLHDARLQIPKASWRGPLSGSWWRALTVEAKVEQLQGGVGKTQTSLVVQMGC